MCDYNSEELQAKIAVLLQPRERRHAYSHAGSKAFQRRKKKPAGKAGGNAVC